MTVSVEKLVSVYIKMRDAHIERKRQFEEEDAKLQEQMKRVKEALLTQEGDEIDISGLLEQEDES